jgi:hypothetical protein
MAQEESLDQSLDQEGPFVGVWSEHSFCLQCWTEASGTRKLKLSITWLPAGTW